MTDPILLSDFLTHTLTQGGMEGMLALHGIFTLVTRYGLEYPAFYAKLYQLITPAALRSKHRVQFFKLVDVFLNSGLVPAYSAASFVKRFARLALTAPAGSAMLCIAFIHNIVRRHPSCMVLLHKPLKAGSSSSGKQQQQQGQQGGELLLLGADGETGAVSANGQAGAAGTTGVGSAAEGAGVDVYDDSHGEPGASRAVESSLWELEALRKHYCPQVRLCSYVLMCMWSSACVSVGLKEVLFILVCEAQVMCLYSAYPHHVGSSN
jgi:U3 small nucleolar RNA-associated protein 19